MSQATEIERRTSNIPHRISPIEVTLFFTAFIAATYGFGIYLFPSLVPEIRRDLGFGYASVGLVTGIAQAGFLAASLLSGLFAPMLGALRMIFGAMAATALSLILMHWLPGIATLGALLALMGASAAAVWVPMVAVCQQAIPPRHQGKALGLMSSGTSYGVFLNGLIVPPLVGAFGWRSVWLVVGLLSLAMFAAALTRLRRLNLVESDRPIAPPAPLRARLRDALRPLGCLVIVIMFLNGLTCMPFQTYLVPLMREDFGWPVDVSTRVWTLIGGVGMVSGIALGWLADRISVKWAMLLTYGLLLGAALLALAAPSLIAPRPLLMNGAGVLFGLAFYAIFGLVPAYVSAMFRGEAATLLFGIGNIALGLGGLLGNFVGGYAKSVIGSFTPIYAVVALAALSLVLLALATPNERRPVRQCPASASM